MNDFKTMIDRLATSLHLKTKAEAPQTPAEPASTPLGPAEGPPPETH